MTQKNALSGFTFIKNGLTLGYPIKESIQSIESLCDEVVINVGFDNPQLHSDDGTYDYLRDHFPQKKFKFLKSFWDPNIRQGGMILSQQTNIALAQCRGQYCQYIQGDEVLHQDDLPAILSGVKSMEQNSQIEGLVFNYLHFYGNTDILKHTRNTYRREVRLIKNHLGVTSWKDAQGFRHQNQQKLQCLKIPARIFHYGWARHSPIMQNKIHIMDKLYRQEVAATAPQFQYQKIWGLKKFDQTHPAVMQKWIQENKNDLDIMSMKTLWEWKNIGLAISDFVEKYTDYRIGEYKNYKLIN